jgi:SAM-dependent methyltransferase
LPVSQDSSAFLDPDKVRGEFYACPDRLVQRSGALHRAKIAGRYVPDVIAELASRWLLETAHPRIADIGCGRGSSTIALASRLPTAHLLAVDLSSALLVETGQRLRTAGYTATLICADFHHLPFADASCDLLVAAFCLYHAREPSQVIGEMARCLAADGIAILVTKSQDSYHELDLLVARAGLDADALSRPSLYATAHSGNLADLAAGAFVLKEAVHHRHTFRFSDLAHVGEYLATTPKYALSASFTGNASALTAALRSNQPDEPLTVTSTVTYVVAGLPGGKS